MVDRGLTPARLGAACLCALACASAQGAPATATPVGSREPSAAAGDGPTGAGFAASFRTVVAKGQGLEFPLPDADGWRLDKREQHTWVARHRRSSSELAVRAWHFDGIARPQDCEREARQWRRELPRLSGAEIIDSRDWRLAESYRGILTVGVRAEGPATPERASGHVLGFASDARQCLMLAFSTSASGPRARSVIAQRLAVIAGSVFERAHRLEIESRVLVPRR